MPIRALCPFGGFGGFILQNGGAYEISQRRVLTCKYADIQVIKVSPLMWPVHCAHDKETKKDIESNLTVAHWVFTKIVHIVRSKSDFS